MRAEILSNPKSISDPTRKLGFFTPNLGFFTPNDGSMSLSETPDTTEVKMSLGRSEKVTPFISSEAISEIDPPSLEIEKLPMSDFGGKEVLVLYTTSLRGIRKTFDDCSKVRFLLESFRVVYSERDVSMHMDYRNELWRILGGRVIPPRLFVRGRYIGGANEVVGLHEKGMLRFLLQGIPVSPSCTCQCDRCGGMRFVVCNGCNGSRKVVVDVESVRCGECNENGLVKCSDCC